MGRLEGRIALVTGAASGIDAGIAVAFAREGADVTVVDLVPEEKASGMLEAIRAQGRQVLFVRADVSDESDVRAMTEQVMERFRRVDILVNNAGIFTQSLLETMPIADWGRVLDVNLCAPSCVHACCSGRCSIVDGAV